MVALPILIGLKVASGLASEQRRLRDLSDVQRLITTLRLPRDFGGELDPSARDEYLRLWTIAQTPDFHEQGS